MWGFPSSLSAPLYTVEIGDEQGVFPCVELLYNRTVYFMRDIYWRAWYLYFRTKYMSVGDKVGVVKTCGSPPTCSGSTPFRAMYISAPVGTLPKLMLLCLRRTTVRYVARCE